MFFPFLLLALLFDFNHIYIFRLLLELKAPIEPGIISLKLFINKMATTEQINSFPGKT